MDYSSLVIVGGILAYGAHEYRRREQLHRLALRDLQEGKEPTVPETRPAILKLWTTGIVAGLLLLAGLGLLFLRPRIIYGGEYLFVLVFIFLTIFLLLLLILVRDIRAHSKKSMG